MSRGYLRPTGRQLEEAQRIGITVTRGMSRGDLSTLIRGTNERLRQEHESVLREQDVEALKQLLEDGLCVQALVSLKHNELYVGWVVSIDDRRGMVSFCLMASRMTVSHPASRLQVLELPSCPHDHDWWHPIGFVQVSDVLVRRILAGDFGKSYQQELKMRDAFFSRAKNARQYYLLKTTMEKILQMAEELQQAEKEKRAQDAVDYRATMDQKFCIACGTQMVRPDNAPLLGWHTRSKCQKCQNQRMVLQEKFCVVCGVKFEKGNTSNREWAPIRNCPSHRKWKRT